MKLMDRNGGLAGFIARRRIPILIAGVLLIALSLWQAGNIEAKTDIQDLLPADNPQAEAFTETNELFSTSNILIAIEGTGKDELAARAEELAAGMATDSELAAYIRNITLGLDREFLTTRMLWMANEDGFADMKEFLKDPHLVPLLTAFNDNLENAWFEEGSEEAVTPSDERELIDMYNRTGQLASLLTRYLAQPEQTDGNAMSEALFLGDKYMYSPMGDMILFRVTPSFSLTERDVLSRVMERVNGHIEAARKAHPDFRYGAAGDIPQEADEEAAMGFDTLYPALAALVVIVILFYLSLYSLRSVVFTLVALCAGIIMDLGILGATIGELNMITSSFGALLVGLGIDFGIHLISYYGELVGRGIVPEEALSQTLKKTGKPVFIGGLTTALAFYALCFSKTKGFVQFGFVAGTGILTVLLAMFFILPALLLVFGRSAGNEKRWKLEYRFLGTWGRMLERRFMVPVVLAAAAVTVFLAFQIPKLSFDYDMRHIGPQNTPAKKTEERILDKLGISPFPSYLTVGSIEEARTFTDVLEKEKLVGMIDSISDLIPSPDAQQKRAADLAGFRESLGPAYEYVFGEEERETLAYEIQRLEWNLIEIADMTAATLGDDNRLLAQRDHLIREIRGRETGREGDELFQKAIEAVGRATYEDLIAVDAAFARGFIDLRDAMLSETSPVGIRDLPEDIKRGLVSSDDSRFLITVFPTEDMVDNAGIFAFAGAMERIDVRITGAVQLALELAREILSEMKAAGLLVLGVVAILLLVTFRSVSATALALGNLAVSVVWMMGLYALIEKMNIVNALALPLIIGIGVDYGIHIIHHIRLGHDLEHTLSKSGKAILLSALTTMIGFGSLALLGTFKGIATLGILLFLGASMCLVCSLTILPALAIKMFFPANKRNADTTELLGKRQ
ncbi:MAG: MMPL family transporter [Spirochaetales bacterium]|nr:MMPL family transporter [Spirochaetales bacterium]